MAFATIPDAVDALRRGEAVIVADDEDRENEGDIVFSAEMVSQAVVAWTVRESSGFICAPLTAEIAEELDLPPMVQNNQDPRGTAYTVTVDASDRLSTGISASDRAHTLRRLSSIDANPSSFSRPGHILPLIAAAGGVLERNGHTEAAVDLMHLAGLRPVAGIAEVVAEDGEMMRIPGLLELGKRAGVAVVTIASLMEFIEANGRKPLAGATD